MVAYQTHVSTFPINNNRLYQKVERHKTNSDENKAIIRTLLRTRPESSEDRTPCAQRTPIAGYIYVLVVLCFILDSQVCNDIACETRRPGIESQTIQIICVLLIRTEFHFFSTFIFTSPEQSSG